MPERKAGVYFCLKQGKICVTCMLRWKKGELPQRHCGQWVRCLKKWVAADRSISLCFVLCTMISDEKGQKERTKPVPSFKNVHAVKTPVNIEAKLAGVSIFQDLPLERSWNSSFWRQFSFLFVYLKDATNCRTTSLSKQRKPALIHKKVS